jgi:hypothetical protein
MYGIGYLRLSETVEPQLSSAESVAIFRERGGTGGGDWPDYYKLYDKLL